MVLKILLKISLNEYCNDLNLNTERILKRRKGPASLENCLKWKIIYQF